MNFNWRITAAVISQSDLYIGNDTGVMHAAAACRLPVIMISSEAEDKMVSPLFRAMNSPYLFFYPWQTNAIVIRPKHALEECKDFFGFGGCGLGKPHCIAQTEPREIVDAYHIFAELITNSKIKKTICPPIISSTNQISHLYYGLTNY